MTLQYLIKTESEAIKKATSERLAFFLKGKLDVVMQLIREREYWQKRAEEAESRAEILNSMYLSTSQNEKLMIEILINSTSKVKN